MLERVLIDPVSHLPEAGPPHLNGRSRRRQTRASPLTDALVATAVKAAAGWSAFADAVTAAESLEPQLNRKGPRCPDQLIPFLWRRPHDQQALN